MSDLQENNEPSTRSVTVTEGEPGGPSEWAEFRAQMHEWRESVERRLPPWWNRALAGALIVIGILLPFFFSADSGFMGATITAVAYSVMALGLNIVVGFAGLLDLGYVAFYALGAYSWGWFASGFFYKAHVHVLVSPVASTLPGIHLNVILVLAAAALICALAGMLIGLPTLRLRGDYIAIVTLAFGEIIGVVAVNGTSIHLGGGMTLTAGNLGISGVDSPYFPGVGLFSELNLRPWYWLIFGVLLLGYINYWLLPSVLNSVPSKLGLNFQLTDVEFGVYGFLLVLVMLLRPQGLLPERRRQMELTAEIAAEDAQLVEVAGPTGGQGRPV